MIKKTIDTINNLGYDSVSTVNKDEWNFASLHTFYSNMIGHFNYFNKPFDSRITDETMNELRLISMIQAEQNRYSTDSLTRILTSEVSKFTLKRFEEDKNISLEKDGHDRKFTVLSAHDMNIIPFLQKYKLAGSDCAIRLYKGEKLKEGESCVIPPEFCANILWELVKDQNQNLFVRTIYNGETVKTICPGNDENEKLGYCPYDKFVDFVNNEMVLDDKMVKSVCYGYYNFGDQTLYITLILLFGLFTIILIGMMGVAVSSLRSTNIRI